MTTPLPRLRHWFGWSRTTPTVGVIIGDADITVLAIRPEIGRITAFGTATLPLGLVRDGDPLVDERVSRTVDSVRRHLRIRRGARSVVLVDPIDATVDRHPETGRLRVRSTFDVDVADRLRSCVAGGGLAVPAIDTVPASLARLCCLTPRPPVCASAGWWSVFAADDHLEITRSRRRSHHLTIGESPTDQEPLAALSSIEVPKRVETTGDWPLLAVTALAADPTRRIGRRGDPMAAIATGLDLIDLGEPTGWSVHSLTH